MSGEMIPPRSRCDDLRRRRETYIIFQQNITGAKALLDIQDMVLIILENDVTFGYNDDTDAEITLTTGANDEKLKTLERVVEKLRKDLDSTKLLYSRSLYYDAVVSIVTAFETYLKNTLIWLMVRNKWTGKKIMGHQKRPVRFNEIENLNINKYTIGNILDIHKFSFFKINKVETAFMKMLGGRNKRFVLFKNETQKNSMRNFLELRHLIVHKGGIVDKRFLNKTGFTNRIGEQYEVTKEYISGMTEAMINLVNKIENEIERQL